MQVNKGHTTLKVKENLLWKLDELTDNVNRTVIPDSSFSDKKYNEEGKVSMLSFKHLQDIKEICML
jgi:hypothetical protein